MENVTNENKLFQSFIESNDNASFNRLFEMVSPWLYRFVYRIVANKEISEDIVQESWAILIKNKNSFISEKGKVSSLLFSIAKNLAFKEISRNKEQYNPINQKILTEKSKKVDNPEEIFIDLERSSIIHSAINGLNKDCQDVIIMFHLAELSIKEISEKLQKPENTIKTLLLRGRARLEKILTEKNQVDLSYLLNLFIVVLP